MVSLPFKGSSKLSEKNTSSFPLPTRTTGSIHQPETLEGFHGGPASSALQQTSGMPECESELMEKEKGIWEASFPPPPNYAYSSSAFQRHTNSSALLHSLRTPAGLFFLSMKCPREPRTALSQDDICHIKTPVHHHPLLILSFRRQECR